MFLKKIKKIFKKILKIISKKKLLVLYYLCEIIKI